jgi:hypothetical protein
MAATTWMMIPPSPGLKAKIKVPSPSWNRQQTGANEGAQ